MCGIRATNCESKCSTTSLAVDSCVAVRDVAVLLPTPFQVLALRVLVNRFRSLQHVLLCASLRTDGTGVELIAGFLQGATKSGVSRAVESTT